MPCLQGHRWASANSGVAFRLSFVCPLSRLVSFLFIITIHSGQIRFSWGLFILKYSILRTELERLSNIVTIRVPGILTMHLLISTLFLWASCIGIQADATQIPLQYSSNISWDFFEKPSRDSTSHLIFDTVNSFLQHWTNTRYRNG